MILSDTAIRRPVFITMIMCCLALFGAICWKTIGVDLYPRVEFPLITVVSVLPGADPKTVESTVTKPIEDAISTISSIKHLRSMSTDGISQVVIEFELEKNVDTAFQEVQAKMGSIRSDLPQDLEDPVVEKFDMDSSPILGVIVGGDLPIAKLSIIADKVVKTRLQQVKDVGQIKLVGKRDRTFWMYLDPHRLEGYSISVPEVIAALQAHHLEVPAGKVDLTREEIVVKTRAEFEDVDQFNDLLLAYRNDYPIRLRDVGRAVDGLEEERSLVRLDTQKAIGLLVRRQSGTNTVSVAKAVKAECEKLQSELAPQHICLQVTQDLSTFIEHSIDEIQFHLLFGAFLAVVIVFIFLRNLRITLMSAIAIPISVISSFLFLKMLGFTMNQMTLLALSLAIGIVIDDAIVVVENIFRHFKTKTAEKAASEGTLEIGLAAFAITMSIVAVFLPVAFMKGIIGRFFYQFGMGVAIAVLLSLFIAFTLTPMLASKFLKKQTSHGRFSQMMDSLFSHIDEGYAALLKKALQYPKIVILVSCSILIFTFITARFLRSEFIPMEDQSEFFIKVKTPLSSSLSTTDEALSTIRSTFANEPWLRYTFTTIGADNLRKVNEGTIYVRMSEKGLRAISQAQAMAKVRQATASFTTWKVSIEQVPRVSGGGRRNCALQLDILGDDLNRLEEIAGALVSKLQATPGYVDIDTSFDKERPELSVTVLRDRAAALGVTPRAIAQTIKTMVGGTDVAKFNDSGERYDITVRADDQFRNRPDLLYAYSVKNAVGEPIVLENLVEVSQTTGPVQIDRYNRSRIISVYVNLQEGKMTLGQAMNQISSIMTDMKLPAGYRYLFSGTADAMKESFANLLFALLLAVVMVYMVLAAQFESFLQPFVIMLSIPFSIVGALLGILVTCSTLNIFTIIGIIMLMGLVSKNAILLVDYANTLRARDGLPLHEALVQAGRTRLHPILMTTCAMIFGMLPIALGTGPGSESRAPMAIAIISGLAVSTLLTLVVVPVVYAGVDRLRKERSNG